MVAELLRLKLRMLLAGFQRPADAIARVVVVLGALVALGGVLAGAAIANGFGTAAARELAVVAGSFLTVAAYLVPAIAPISEFVSPHALRSEGIRAPAGAGAMLLLTVAGPALLALPVAVAPVLLWRGTPGEPLAWLVAPLLFVQAVVAVRLGVATASALGRHPRIRWLVRFAGAVVLAAGALLVVAVVVRRLVLVVSGPALSGVFDTARALRFVDVDLSRYLEWSPSAAFWLAPAEAAVRHPTDATVALLAGLATTLALGAIWWAVIARAFRPTRRVPPVRRAPVPGWFRLTRSTTGGAVVARALSYWLRDPRYLAVFAILPVLPAVSLLALWVGGVPFSYSVLVPLPIMVAVLAWSTIHNDVAYDSTAVWLHLVAPVDGLRDRVGRAVPVLVFGTLLIAVGTPLTAWGYGDPLIAPAVLGVAVAVLFGGVGVGSAVSARFPYPAPRPGDSAFRQPQAAQASGGLVQVFTFLLVLLVASPAVIASGVWLSGAPGPWSWIALGAGLLSGAIALAIGVRAGAGAFDRRAPELLAFAVRN